MGFHIEGDPIFWPGNPEPVEGNCNSRLSNKTLRGIAASGHKNMPTCYCARVAGWGTPHKGTGTCKMHLGNAHTQMAKAERARVEQTIAERVASLGAPPPIRDPYIELWDMAAKSKQWMVVAEDAMGELTGMVSEDNKGTEQTREQIAIWERAFLMARDGFKEIVKLDIKRKVGAIRQDHANAIGELVQSVRDDPRLELTDHQVEMWQVVFREKFPTVSGRLELPDMPVIDAVGWEDDDVA